MTVTTPMLRLAAVADLHVTRASQGALQPVVAGLVDHADALLLCGDLTDYGLPEEAQVLVQELVSVRIPIVAVLGNHDYESGRQDEVKRILCDAGINVLDGEACEVAGAGFAGAKGFAGGFGRYALEPWGESGIKGFVQDAVDEALKLERAIARMQARERVVLLHYSPVRDTVQGEPPEIFPFLGSSRLEEPLNRYDVTAVFHGHAHHGSPDGRTAAGIPVYNVALPLVRQAHTGGPLARIVEIPRTGADDEAA